MTPAPERPSAGDEGACAGVDHIGEPNEKVAAHPQQARDEGGPDRHTDALVWATDPYQGIARTVERSTGKVIWKVLGPDVGSNVFALEIVRLLNAAPLHNEAEQGLREKVAEIINRVVDADYDGKLYYVEDAADAILQAISQHPVKP